MSGDYFPRSREIDNQLAENRFWIRTAIIGALIIGGLFLLMIITMPEDQSDDGRQFDDTNPSTVETFPGLTDEEIAKEVVSTDPISVCRDIAIMDRQSMEMMFEGLFIREGVEEYAYRIPGIYDAIVKVCTGE